MSRLAADRRPPAPRTSPAHLCRALQTRAATPGTRAAPARPEKRRHSLERRRDQPPRRARRTDPRIPPSRSMNRVLEPLRQQWTRLPRGHPWIHKRRRARFHEPFSRPSLSRCRFRLPHREGIRWVLPTTLPVRLRPTCDPDLAHNRCSSRARGAASGISLISARGVAHAAGGRLPTLGQTPPPHRRRSRSARDR